MVAQVDSFKISQSNMAVVIVLLVVGVGVIVGAWGRDDLRVSVKQGVLEGVEKVNRVNKEPLYAFFGIPYAMPPLGERRFKHPEDPLPWEGVFNATTDDNTCLSYNIFYEMTEGSEDCLVLNVYTSKKPQEAKDSLRPVMVWIHGGAFLTDSGIFSLYGPDFLVRHDIVLVTLNYRLNVFGFLSVQDDLVPGNAGLKDQLKALQWVKENIEAFGGDPNCVTLFGQSAGAASVHYLMLSPNGRGLFHRAIAMSGVAISPWASIPENKETAYKLGDVFDCNTTISAENNTDLIECLRQAKAEKLVAYQYNLLSLKIEEFLTKNLNLPCIEPEGTENAILTEPPFKLLESGNFTDVPFMLGTVRMESLVLEKLFTEEFLTSVTKYLVHEVDKKPHLLLPQNLKFGDVKTKKMAGKKAKLFYFQNERISNKTLENFINMTSDSWFLFGVHETALLHAKQRKSPVYLYHITYRDELPVLWTDFSTPGPGHSQELRLFFYRWNPEIEIPPKQLEVLDKIQKLWVNFAKFGNPTPDKVSSEVIWEPYTPDKQSYLEIDKNFTMKAKFLKERMEFWTKLVSEANATFS